MTPRLDFDLSEGVYRALARESERSGEDLSAIVDRLLSTALELDRHSLFQVSTSNALVQGVFRGAVTVGALRRHGDFGLGTFDGLDGELIMLDGACFRASGGGIVTTPPDQMGVPFAVITRFHPDIRLVVEGPQSLGSLTKTIDQSRPSENLFVGLRVEGRFTRLAMRAACAAAPGEGLLEATGHQSEFTASDVEGTVLGFWAPTYAKAVNVPGYHFHFISEDRSLGGHVLDLEVGPVKVAIHLESELHIAIPETEEFLRADLSGDHQRALHQAETARHQDR